VGAADAIVDSNEDLRDDSKPKGAGRAGVTIVGETMGEPLFKAGKGLESYGALRYLWEFVDLDGVGDSDGVGVGGGFDGREGEFSKGDGNGGFSDIGDVVIHERLNGRPKGRRGRR